MRKRSALAAFAASALLAGQAHAAEHWIWFTVTGGAVAYDELSQFIDIRTGIVSANTVTYYQQPHAGAGAGGVYTFLAERLDFECRGNRYRFSNSAAFDKTGLRVSEREDGEWTEMGATLGSSALFRRMLCTADKPPVVYEAANVDALFKAMTSPTPPAIAASTAPAAPAASSTSARPAATTTTTAPAPKAAAQTAAKPPEPPKIQPRPLDLDALAASLASSAGPAAAPSPAPGLRP